MNGFVASSARRGLHHRNGGMRRTSRSLSMIPVDQTSPTKYLAPLHRVALPMHTRYLWNHCLSFNWNFKFKITCHFYVFQGSEDPKIMIKTSDFYYYITVILYSVPSRLPTQEIPYNSVPYLRALLNLVVLYLTLVYFIFTLSYLT